MGNEQYWYDLEDTWQARIAGWITASEWSRDTAAYLLIGLDPENTHGTCDSHDFGPYWLTPHCKIGLPTNSYDLDHHLRMLLQRSREETRRTKRSKVSTPSEWIKWSAMVRLEPPWLKAAYGERQLVKFLPELPAYRDMVRGAAELHREVSSKGGKRRSAKSAAGRAHKLLLPQIVAWRQNPTTETSKAFAERLQDGLKAHQNAAKDAPWAEIETIQRWIRKQRSGSATDGTPAG